MDGGSLTRGKTGVLFLNSPEYPGADTFIQTLFMRVVNRCQYEVHTAYSPGKHGARTKTQDLLAQIDGVHMRASNFGPSFAGRSKAARVRLAVEGIPALLSVAGLGRYIKRHQIAILHSSDRPRDAVSCVLLGKLTGARSIIHVHVKYASWMSHGVRWAMDQADVVVGVSEFVAHSLTEHVKRPEKTHVVRNAIDVAAWDYRLDPRPVRSALGLTPDAPVIACAGRLFRGKGQDDLVRALSLVRREVPDVRLVVIGEDDRLAMSTSFSDELKQLVTALGLSNHVVFTGYRPDMPALLACSDVFALPSSEEPFGLVFAEAMAMKKPVVALDDGGTPEVVEHGKCGLLSAKGDLNSMAVNLVTLLRDRALRLRMGEYGRRRVETHFGLDRFAKDAASLYAAVSAA
jgi:glycosyltransferase involved in cell wall biosynthesis